jgi:hypothetical protein
LAKASKAETTSGGACTISMSTPSPPSGKLLVALRVDERHIEASRALADATGSEAHALPFQPAHRGAQVVYPKAQVVERRVMHARLAVRVHRLHQVHLDAEGPGAGHQMSSSTFSRSLR